MKKTDLCSLIYVDVNDDQKAWVEFTNPIWRHFGTKGLIKNIEKEVERNSKFVDSLLARMSGKPKVVVDVGAGYAGTAINFALKKIKTIVIEPSSLQRRCIENILKKYPSVKKNIKILDGVAEKLPLLENSVDLLILSEVLEHVNNVQKSMKEVARVLKPNGYAYISFPNYLFPVEQHYHLAYWPLMSKRLFSIWANFLLIILNIQKQNTINRDFSKIKSFIYSINYMTDSRAEKLFQKNNLTVKWSTSQESKNLIGQVKQHWTQNRTLPNLLFVAMSLPIKVVRVVLALIGLLPKDLQYLICKEESTKIKESKN